MRIIKTVKPDKYNDTCRYKQYSGDIYIDLSGGTGAGTGMHTGTVYCVTLYTELEEEEDTQYPLEDILDKYSAGCTDVMEEKKTDDGKRVFIFELECEEEEGIKNICSLAGRRVYNYREGGRVLLGMEQLDADAPVKVSSGEKTMPKQTGMICPGCGGPMNLSGDRLRMICPYCGQSYLLENHEEIIKEQIRNDAYVEVAKERMHIEEEREKLIQEKTEHKKFRKSFLFVFIILFIIICAAAGFLSFYMGNTAAGAVAVLQIVLVLLAALFGTGVLSTKRDHLPVMLTMISVLLLLLFLACSYYGLVKTDREKIRKQQEQTYLWPSDGLALLLPEPPTQYGEIDSNDSEEFMITLYQVTEEDYQNYIRACEEAGFLLDEAIDSGNMHAYNEDGYFLRLYYRDYDGEQISVRLEAPVSMADIDWKGSVEGTAGKLLPEPVMIKDGNGKISALIQSSGEDYFSAYLKMTKEQYASYMNACIEAGFNKDLGRDETELYAQNSEGYALSMRYRGYDTVEIYINHT